MKKETETFSHIMYLLFIVAVAFAAYYTFSLFNLGVTTEEGIKAIIWLLWAFLFKRFAHLAQIHG